MRPYSGGCLSLLVLSHAHGVAGASCGPSGKSPIHGVSRKRGWIFFYTPGPLHQGYTLDLGSEIGMIDMGF